MTQANVPRYERTRAPVVELVDAPDSKSGSERSVGSSPTRGTNRDPTFVHIQFVQDAGELAL